jgi:hypothetical protein
MRKLGAALLVFSNIAGNAACAVAAWYAMASYYGWNRPVVAATPANHVAMSSNISPILIVLLALFGFALLIPTWVIMFRALRVQEARPVTGTALPPVPIATSRLTPTVGSVPLATTVDPAIPADPRPQQLMDLCVGRTSVEIQAITRAHEGEELLNLSGVVFNVSTMGDESGNIAIEFGPTKSGLILARFGGKDRVARAVTLRKGDNIKVSGRIQEISKDSIVLTDCEFVRA